jgi:hypothetical protein
MSLVHSIRLMDPTSIAETHELHDYRPFERLTRDWKAQLQQLSDSIALQYWVHAGSAHQLTEVRRS